MGLQSEAPRAENETQRMTLVLAAPQADDDYYAPVYDGILDFQLDYARAIAAHDDAVILVDDAAYDFFARHLPDEMLLPWPMADIWARDYSPVFATAPLAFRYAAAAQGGSQATADRVQRGFTDMANELGLSFARAPEILDGGNFVSDGQDKAIVTDRFLEDNDLSKAEGVRALKRHLGLGQVAIIPNDDPEGLAHADGMVMFTDPDTLFVTAYDEPFRSAVLGELEAAFPEVTIVQLPAAPDDEVWDERFSSACGIYVNSVVTRRAVYVPQFGSPHDREALDLIRDHTRKAVVPIPAEKVCFMGGSARCLVWELAGSDASRLLQAAREE